MPSPRQPSHELGGLLRHDDHEGIAAECALISTEVSAKDSVVRASLRKVREPSAKGYENGERTERRNLEQSGPKNTRPFSAPCAAIKQTSPKSSAIRRSLSSNPPVKRSWPGLQTPDFEVRVRVSDKISFTH